MALDDARQYNIVNRREYLEKQIARGWRLMKFYIDSGQRETPVACEVKAMLVKYETELNGILEDGVSKDAFNYIHGG